MKYNELTRRDLLAKLGLATGVSVLGVGLSQLSLASEVQQRAGAFYQETDDKPWFELRLLDDAILDQVFLFYLGHAFQGLSDIGECYDTQHRVKAGDPWSWPLEWEKTADRLKQLASESESQGHLISAGQAYLRASNYYIASMHRHPDAYHPGIRKMTEASVACFSKSIKYLDMPVEEVEIPFEDTTLPGYFYRSPTAGKNAPTMIIFNGRDAWAIQDKILAEEGNKRGYHVMLFDGPGQGPVLRLKGLPFRHDWEKVITPVVDYTLKMEGVDADRLGVMGISMGGFLVTRAAAFEYRPKVYVANPGVVNWAQVIEVTFEQLTGPEGLKLVDTDPEAFDQLIYGLMKQIPLIEWGMDDMYWKHGAKTPTEVMLELRKYNNSVVVSQIRSKMLLLHGDADEWSQVEELQKSLKSRSDLVRFTAEEAGQLHCQTAAWGIHVHKLYNWLDENLKA